MTVRPSLDFRSSIAIRNEFLLLADSGVVPLSEGLAALSEGYLIYGIESWTLTDAKDNPVEVSRTNVRESILSRPEIAVLISDAADTLYGATILPLVMRAAKSSQPTPTTDSTSAQTSPSESQTQPLPSLTTTSPTGDTETTLPPPAGDSN